MPAHVDGFACDPTLARVFAEGRSFSSWQPKPVTRQLLEQAYRLASLGPTSMNSQPARFVLLESESSRARLLPHLAPPNVEKTRTAPLTILVAVDFAFYVNLPKLYPHRPQVRDMYVANEKLAAETARRNGAMSAAYLICALRALGLDCGPMSGFDAPGVDAEFFRGGEWKSELVLNVGYGDRDKLLPRLPRLDWAEAWLCI